MLYEVITQLAGVGAANGFNLVTVGDQHQIAGLQVTQSLQLVQGIQTDLDDRLALVGIEVRNNFV